MFEDGVGVGVVGGHVAQGDHVAGDPEHGGLLRLQRELSKTLARKDTRQLKSQCPADVLLAPEERLERDLRRLLHAREQGIP